ncbi:MAG: ABC transporter permease [Chloroflexi bacterium]|nr:ABC transporter permease [Chloroflexota bacterium]
MVGYILRRLLFSGFALVGVAFITFLAVFASGDPVALLLPPEANEAQIREFRQQMGLDRPLPVQFAAFAGRAIQGDFGRSLRHDVPAMGLVLERLPSTMLLAFTAVLLAAAVGIPLGILAAARQGSWLDDAVVALSTLGLAAPTFWIGTMLIVVFAVNLKVLPPSGGESWDRLIMPAITLALGFIAVLARFTRSGMLDVLSREYINTARAKGLPARAILFGHALRNTLIPIVTLLGLEMGQLLGGAVVTENVFAWPGIGRLVVTSVASRDVPLVVAAVVVTSALFIAVNLLVDVLYSVINPMVRQ